MGMFFQRLNALYAGVPVAGDPPIGVKIRFLHAISSPRAGLKPRACVRTELILTPMGDPPSGPLATGLFCRLINLETPTSPQQRTQRLRSPPRNGCSNVPFPRHIASLAQSANLPLFCLLYEVSVFLFSQTNSAGRAPSSHSLAQNHIFVNKNRPRLLHHARSARFIVLSTQPPSSPNIGTSTCPLETLHDEAPRAGSFQRYPG